MPDMIVRTSAKSRLMSPGTRIRSEMPCTACSSTVSATLNASISGVPRSTTASSRWFGMRDQRVDHLAQLREAGLGLLRALPSLEDERLGDDGDREDAELLGHLRDDGRGAGAGAAAEAGGDEDHVGALEHFLRSARGPPGPRSCPISGSEPGAEPLP